MVRKFIMASQNPVDIAGPDSIPPFRKTYYFFYCTLMDPETLGNVLKRAYSPEARPAVTWGPRLKLWGEYPALVSGPKKEIICGVACEIQSQQEADRLAAYETDMYRVQGCPIYFDDGEDAGGRIFRFVGDESLLTEGIFDMKDWLLRKREYEIQTER